MQLSSVEYWKEVSALAQMIVSEAADYAGCNTADTFDRDTVLEKIHDFVLPETIDGHQWVVYYAYNLSVLENSDNSDYMVDNLGAESAGEVLKESGLSGLHSALAFWALYADVQDRIESALDQYESNLESEEGDQE
jgi:hypothetical protein